MAMLVGGFMNLTPCFGQDSTENCNGLSINGYAELYYIQDFNRPGTHRRPGFIYSHNRSGELAFNLGYLKASYENTRLRANLAFAAGSYMNANYAAESGTFKNLYEANIGVRLSAKYNIWLDGGILPSHIGFESAVGADNWTVTRSLAAENSPYFETGVSVGFTSKNNKWYTAALILNGWQRIERVEGNSGVPAFGMQLTYKPNPEVTLNYSAYAGSDQPDSLKKMRFFNNIYGVFQLNSKIGIIAGLDVGFEQSAKDSRDYNRWYAPGIIIQYRLEPKIILAARGEYYADPDNVVVSTGTVQGFKTFGFSGNIDYRISSLAMCRLEIRRFKAKDPIFLSRGGITSERNTAITMALTIRL